MLWPPLDREFSHSQAPNIKNMFNTFSNSLVSLSSRMNLKLKLGLILAAIFIPCTFIFLIVLQAIKSNRWSQGASSNYTTQYIPSWSPPTTPHKPLMSTQQVGDASDGIATKAHAAFSQDGRGHNSTTSGDVEYSWIEFGTSTLRIIDSTHSHGWCWEVKKAPNSALSLTIILCPVEHPNSYRYAEQVKFSH